MTSNDNGDKSEKSPRIPTALAKHMKDDSVAIRFEAIGDSHRFRTLLQHFRSEFVLAQCEERDSLKWWLIAESQFTRFVNFCSNHGLKLTTIQDE